MYRPRAFTIDDAPTLHEIIRKRVFATIAAVIDGAVQFAYAPVVLDPETGARGGIRFHLARGNPLTGLDGARVRLSFLGPDAYVSPDWYETPGYVPTWNYIAVEGEGIAKRLGQNELRALLVDLSAAQEEPLRPKLPWTLDKLPEERIAALLGAIEGFSLAFDTLEGKFKLSQDKKPEDIAGVIAGFEARGDAASLAVAAAMRKAGEGDDV
jgi:transcriptional regulator